METKDFEKALPKVLKRIGLKENGWVASMLKEGSPVFIKTPEGFDFKSYLRDRLEKSGINMVYVDIKIFNISQQLFECLIISHIKG